MAEKVFIDSETSGFSLTVNFNIYKNQIYIICNCFLFVIFYSTIILLSCSTQVREYCAYRAPGVLQNVSFYLPFFTTCGKGNWRKIIIENTL